MATQKDPSRIRREHTWEFSLDEDKTCSELHGDMQSAAEMTAPAKIQ